MAIGKEVKTKIIEHQEHSKDLRVAMEMVAASKMRRAQERLSTR